MRQIALLVFVLILLSKASSFCQQPKPIIERQVLAYAGAEVTQNGISVCWTLGEAVIATVPSSTTPTIFLTQGFQQPETKDMDPSIVVDVSGVAVKIFPNPAQDILNVGFDKNNSPTITAQIYDMGGKLHIETQISASINTIPINTLSVGQYILTLTHEGKVMQSILIIKS